VRSLPLLRSTCSGHSFFWARTPTPQEARNRAAKASRAPRLQAAMARTPGLGPLKCKEYRPSALRRTSEEVGFQREKGSQ